MGREKPRPVLHCEFQSANGRATTAMKRRRRRRFPCPHWKKQLINPMLRPQSSAVRPLLRGKFMEMWNCFLSPPPWEVCGVATHPKLWSVSRGAGRGSQLLLHPLAESRSTDWEPSKAALEVPASPGVWRPPDEPPTPPAPVEPFYCPGKVQGETLGAGPGGFVPSGPVVTAGPSSCRPTGTPVEVVKALQALGYSSFRPGQEVAIMRILSGGFGSHNHLPSHAGGPRCPQLMSPTPHSTRPVYAGGVIDRDGQVPLLPAPCLPLSQALQVHHLGGLPLGVPHG